MYLSFNRIKRGRLNESVINKYFQDINQDLLSLYMELYDINETTEVLKKVGNMHTNMLDRLNNIITTKIDALGAGITTNTLYNSDDVFFPKGIKETEYSYVDYDFGIGTCGVQDTKRIFTVIKDDEIALSQTAYDNVSRVISNNKFKKKADKVIENDIMRAFDPQDPQPYLLTVQTKDEAFTEAELILDILNINETVNFVKMRPVPLLELDIARWKLVDNTGETSITNPLGTELSIPIQNAENIFTTFPEKEVSSMNMIVQQKNKSETLPYRFSIGFSDITIGYNEYYNKSYIGFRFTVPKDESGDHKRLKAVNFNWTYLNGYTKAYVYNDKDDADNLVEDNRIGEITTDNITYNKPLVINNDYVYVIVELNKLISGTSPMIRSASVQFI